MIKTNASVLIAYIVVVQNPLMVSHASHFVSTYLEHPPGYPHHLVIVSNGGPLPAKLRPIFAGLKHEFYPRLNDGGWDISAYIEIALRYESDLQVCLGESVYFHRRDWLRRTMECVSLHGKGMYGYFSSYLVRPHLNTTAFAVSPEYLREYPAPSDKPARYEFEHGVKALWRRIAAKGGATRLVTWDGCWEPADWRKPKDILWRGNQSNCLVLSNHTDKFMGATDQTKRVWSHGADALAK